MSTSHLRLVQGVLTEEYGQTHPSSIKKKDFQIGIQLFTKLAVLSNENLNSSSSETSPKLSEKKVKSESGSKEGTTTKIKEFVKAHSYAFWRACETGLPFSMLESAVSEAALKKALDSYDSIIVHLIKQDDSVWLTEEELDKSFGEVFKRLNILEVGNACLDLKQAYTHDGDKKAGYYLLWLIKHASGCNFKIPLKETFDGSTVKEVLSQFTSSETSTLKYPVNFAEILHSRRIRLDSPMCQDFLAPSCRLIFLNFAVNQLQSIPMAAWPNKGELITDLLETVTNKNKIVIAEALESSPDPQTAKIGHHILNALRSTTLTKAIPHFYALTELLPNFNCPHVRITFGMLFETFREDKQCYKNDPDFTRRLNFNGMREVFVNGDLMIGVYDTFLMYGNLGLQPHLVAYNMKTEKMQWGIPLTPTPPEDLSLNPSQTRITSEIPKKGLEKCYLDRVGENITLQFKEEKKVHFIDPNTGETKATIVLPYERRAKNGRLHLTPSGVGYQMVNLKGIYKLIGGKISDSRLNPTFEVDAPGVSFLPLSTHVGFHQNSEDKLVIFGPSGKHVTIDYLSAYGLGDKLYLIEPNPSQENTCKLTIRTMTTGDDVVSEPEKSIILKTKMASIEKLCDNGELILFNCNSSNQSPIFVCLESEEIIYGEHKFPSFAKQVINTVSGELWSWDTSSREIWKISSKETVLMGSLKDEPGMTLVHVDQSDHLYFVSIH